MSFHPSEIPEGRVLDALIAQNVFGLTVEPRNSTRTGETDYFRPLHPGAPPQEWMRIPFYSVSLAAAINLDVELQRRGWRRVDSNDKDTGDIRVILQHTDGRRVDGYGRAPVALCRAALKALAAPGVSR